MPPTPGRAASESEETRRLVNGVVFARKKAEAIKILEGAMDVGRSVETDGTGAVVNDKKDAAAHAPAAEAVPKLVPTELPDAADEMEGWTSVKKKKHGADRWRVSLIVRGGTAQKADRLAKFLFKCATHATMRRLPNAANN